MEWDFVFPKLVLQIDEDAVVSMKPLGLRDGSLLLCRDEIEYLMSLSSRPTSAEDASKRPPAGSSRPSVLSTRRPGFGKAATTATKSPSVRVGRVVC
jgi:hypothetical protein